MDTFKNALMIPGCKIILMIAGFVFVSSVAAAQLTVTWKQLDSMSKGIKSLTYKTTNDTTLKIYYIKPTHIKPGEKLPAVVWIHGGGWTAGTASTFFSHAAYFSLRGAVGISIEYRLIKKGTSEITDCIADCKLAIRYIKAHAKELNIDTSKIIIAGDSAGGHLAACMATIEDFNNVGDNTSISAHPNALLLFNPGLDMTVFPLMKNMSADALRKNSPPLDTIAFTKQFYPVAYAVSPLFHVKRNLPPALLMHGSEDKVILPQQSINFADSMQKKGNVCKLIILQNTRHAFVVPYYTASEEKVVMAVCEADRFLVSLGYLNGAPILKVGSSTAWPAKY